jgi:hypothetical protein
MREIGCFARDVARKYHCFGGYIYRFKQKYTYIVDQRDSDGGCCEGKSAYRVRRGAIIYVLADGFRRGNSVVVWSVQVPCVRVMS